MYRETTIRDCFYCSLPITGSPYRARVGDSERHFCCYGCSLVFRMFGRRGEPGQSSLVLSRLLAGGVFGMVVMAISWSTYLDAALGGSGQGGGDSQPDVLLYRVYLPLAASLAILILGLPIAAGAIAGLRQRRVGLDTLIVVGVSAAYLHSLIVVVTGQGHPYFDTGVAILFFVTLGRYLESQAKARTAQNLRLSFQLVPPRARVLRNGRDVTIAAAEVQVGELVLVHAGESFPVDGRVLEGEGGVNESALTGEDAPVLRLPGETVMAGSTNLDGAFTIVAERVGEDTVAARVGHLLDEARRTRGPLVRLADRAAGILIVAATLLAATSFAYWTWRDGPERGLMVALAVLLVACPCALGIATPLAVWVGLGEAARRGVLLRSGEVMERLGRTRRVFLDKTGTVTSGRLAVGEMVLAGEDRLDPEEVWQVACSAGRLSAHPMGRALAERGSDGSVPLPRAARHRYHAGLGVEAELEGVPGTVVLGSRRLLERHGLTPPPDLAAQELARASQGESIAFLGWGGRVQALIGFTAQLRPEAPDAIARLARMGPRVSMLTGDGEAQARAVGARLGVADVRWSLLPEAKVDEIARARGESGQLVFVGDGINDAPALAAADIGIAMGCGADLAREAAAVSLIGDDLALVPWTLGLSRQVRRTVIWNLVWAVSHNSVGLALAATGVLSPWMSAVIMVLSSVLVTANSTRRRWASGAGARPAGAALPVETGPSCQPAAGLALGEA